MGSCLPLDDGPFSKHTSNKEIYFNSNPKNVLHKGILRMHKSHEIQCKKSQDTMQILKKQPVMANQGIHKIGYLLACIVAYA